MAWIELHTRLKEHPKTYALMEALHINKVSAIGHLSCLWLWAIENAEDGNLTPFPMAAIASAAEWPKKAQTFADALVSCGWLERKDGALLLHDWDDYTWRYLDKMEITREQTRKRVAEYKKRKKALPGNAETVTKKHESNVGNAPTVPNLTKPTKLSGNRQQAVSTVEAPETPPQPPQYPGLIDVLKHWETAFSGFPSPILQDKLKAFLGNGMTPDVLCAAIDETALTGAQAPQRYVVSILQSWYAAGVRDEAGLEAHRAREQGAKPNSRGAPPTSNPFAEIARGG